MAAVACMAFTLASSAEVSVTLFAEAAFSPRGPVERTGGGDAADAAVAVIATTATASASPVRRRRKRLQLMSRPPARGYPDRPSARPHPVHAAGNSVARRSRAAPRFASEVALGCARLGALAGRIPSQSAASVSDNTRA